MSSNILGELAGNNGTFIVNGYTNVNKKADAIVVLEDTIFNNIKINDVIVNDFYILDSSIPVKAGAILTPTGDDVFSGLELESGSVVLVLA